MKNPFKGLTKGIKNLTAPQVKLKFSTCGEVLIDGLPFSFGVQSNGIASEKGLVAAISGEAVSSGKLTFDKIELSVLSGGTVKTISRKLEKVTKKDGKKIYQARFPELVIPAAMKSGALSGFRKMSEDEFMAQLNAEISFKVTPKYKEPEESEVMITVYPIENPLGGLAVSWKNCTSDKDWFKNKFANKKD